MTSELSRVGNVSRPNLLVLALFRGGLPVGYEVAGLGSYSQDVSQVDDEAVGELPLAPSIAIHI